MSASYCIKCENIVGGYEKYCDDCIRIYGVKQDAMFHKGRTWMDWDIERKFEFEKDLKDVPATHIVPRTPSGRLRTKAAVEIKAVYIPNAGKSGKQYDSAYRKRFGSRSRK
jgi:hypothetical protein